MKRLLILLGLCCSLLLIYGCDQNSQVTNPTSDPSALGALVQRPDFVDHRPAGEIVRFTKLGDPQVYALKPPPPPDPGGTTDPNPNPAHKYAYVVGISDYEGTANDLTYCDDDARNMISYFNSQGFTVRSDIDRNATAANIEANLTWLMNAAVAGDEIAFYYSGHGTTYSNYGSCLISTDLYYLTNAWVMQFINGANCSKKFVPMDACKLSSFHTGVPAGMIMATASTSGYSYDAPDLGSGAWTYYFLEATETMIYAEDICNYANAGMKAWASAHRLKVAPKMTDNYTGKMDI
jgi:hypothetical protein